MQQLKQGIDQPGAPREFQLGYYPPGTEIAPDVEIVNFIKDQGYDHAVCIGDASFILEKTNLKVVTENAKFGMFFQFDSYRFDILASKVNHVLTHNMEQGGVLYLSVNKYVAIPDVYDTSLSDDYDQAIYEYIAKHVNGEILTYRPCGYDGGDQFNWIHPLTRFYLKAIK